MRREEKNQKEKKEEEEEVREEEDYLRMNKHLDIAKLACAVPCNVPSYLLSTPNEPYHPKHRLHRVP